MSSKVEQHTSCYAIGVARQPDLFSITAVVGFDASFAGVRRCDLAQGAWVEHVPGWLRGDDALFDDLHAG